MPSPPVPGMARVARNRKKTLCTGGGPDGPFQVLARPEDGNLDHVELDIDAFELGRQTYQLTCDADETCTTLLNGGTNKLTFQFYPSFKDAASASLFLFTTVDCAHRGGADKDSNLTRTTIPI